MDYLKIQAAVSEALFNKPASVLSGPVNTRDDGDVSADVDTILASTEKLLAVNRGLAEPDERDSLEFRRVMSPDKLFAERVDSDAGKIMNTAMHRVGRARSLKHIGAAHFDSYMQGLIVGNPLSSPLEEINPVSLVEQARRITQMGPGGLPSTDSITEASQSLHPSTFGFLDSISGPESEKIGVDTRLAWGTKWGSDGNIYQRFFDRRSKKHRWMSPSDVAGHVIGLPR